LRALGLCAKAGKLIAGTPLICEALKARKGKSGGVLLVLTSSDNSGNTAKRLNDRCAYYGVRTVMLEISGEELAEALGKRSRVAAVAVTDENLCRLVEKTLQQAPAT
jgi:ribosomal protein L7Ae-like RNA K-turn-binding protein